VPGGQGFGCVGLVPDAPCKETAFTAATVQALGIRVALTADPKERVTTGMCLCETPGCSETTARRQEIDMGISEIIATRRGEILAAAARHGVTSIKVFGSVARGDAREDSDVDFLVEVGPQHSAFFPGGLVADLQDILGRRVDVVEPEGLHRLLKDQILREAVQL
jgi:predicted nucleotidyltransferase